MADTAEKSPQSLSLNSTYESEWASVSIDGQAQTLHDYGEDIFGRGIEHSWRCDWSETTIDNSTTSTSAIDPLQPGKYCNNPTALHSAHPAQMDDRCTRFIFDITYREWFRCYNHELRLYFEHVFANPNRVTTTDLTSMSGFLEEYEYPCHQASSLLGKIQRDEIGGPLKKCFANASCLSSYRDSSGWSFFRILTEPGWNTDLDHELQRQIVIDASNR